VADSSYSDLARPPLHALALTRALVTPGGRWTEVRVVAETGSTNADLVALAQHGAPEGAVLVAERQSAGRGRLDRSWTAPARAGITMSLLLRPEVPLSRLGWLPLLAGVALAEAVGRVAMVDAVVKWPNDLLVRSATDRQVEAYGKCAGLLAETVPGPAGSGGSTPAVVLGIGLNVSQRADELPELADPAAVPPTSLALTGALCVDRDPLLRAVLRAFDQWYGEWLRAGGDAESSGVRGAYQKCCVTLGQRVSVLLPDAATLVGLASDVDSDGRLVVATDDGMRAVAAGDVRHVR
jgi:BirA family transcriptional regulator, biotin operon repressor / biotin---[acetyl-CoA-carboxylase] ligase